MLTHTGLQPLFPIDDWERDKLSLLRETVLMTAIMQKDVAMVRLLLDHGADPNLPEFYQFADGGDESDDGGGDDRNEEDFDDDDDDKWSPDYWVHPGVRSRDLATPLSVALGVGDETLVALLRARGATDCDGRAPFPYTTACHAVPSCDDKIEAWKLARQRRLDENGTAASGGLIT